MADKNARNLNFLCGLITVGLILFLFKEHRAWAELNQANQDLRRQLSQTTALLADNQQLLAMLPARDVPSTASKQQSAVASTPKDPASEILLLRGEAQALRQENKVIETLREDTRQARLASASGANLSRRSTLAPSAGANASAPQLEILHAVYGTANARVDVTDDLRGRIRDDSLKTIINNSLKGDPEFGEVKNLTVEYRYAGVTMTNQFREGSLVVIPPEPNP